MKVTKAMLKRAQRVEYLARGACYHVAGGYIAAGDLSYNDAKQTPNEVASFTVALAHLLSTSGGPFVTALTEEAAGYIDDWAVEDYEKRVREACKRVGYEFPEAQ